MGLAWSISATTPETIGVAAEVPLKLSVYWFCSAVVDTSGREGAPSIPSVRLRSADGAQTVRLGPRSLYGARVPAALVAQTVTMPRALTVPSMEE